MAASSIRVEIGLVLLLARLGSRRRRRLQLTFTDRINHSDVPNFLREGDQVCNGPLHR